MQIIITGATGHIGNNLVRYLLNNQSEDIKLLVRNCEDPAIIDLKCQKVCGDITNSAFLEQEITKDSVVIHCAGIISITKGNKKIVDQVNYEATKKLVDICLSKEVSKFIYISSVDALYKKDKREVITEPTSFYPELIKGDYGKSKALATQYVYQKLVNQELKGCILYPSAVIGPYDYKVSSIGQVLVDNIHHHLMARLKGGYNFIDVRDVASSISYAATHEVGISYLLTGESISVDELFMIINDKLGRQHLPIKLPLFLVKGVALIMPLYYKTTKKRPVLTLQAVRTLNSNHNYDNTLAVRDLHLQIRSPKTSINDAIDWFIIHGN